MKSKRIVLLFSKKYSIFFPETAWWDLVVPYINCKPYIPWQNSGSFEKSNISLQDIISAEAKKGNSRTGIHSNTYVYYQKFRS